MNKKWQYKTNQNEEETEKIVKRFNLNKTLAQIMVNRGITVDTAEVFLNPKRNDFYNPFEMPDMEQAVDRIIKAINSNEKVTIYGDYDVDGITSSTVLKKFLKDRGLDCGVYIPNRIDEGYGLNIEAIEKIKEDNYTLIITVDCGITSIKEVEYAKKIGIDVIVTDHHEPGDIIPNTIAVIDCKRKDSKYQFRELCGVGVAFKLTQAISQRLKLDEKEYLKYLDIVSIGTIADIVPLVDENRVITKLGLKLVECTKNVGLDAIIKTAGYKKVNSISIAFGVAPRINASGRIGSAYTALNLLLDNDKEKAIKIAEELNSLNLKRQEEEKQIFDEAINQIEENGLSNDSIIVLKGKNWHAGIIGIVASRITELYYKPSILISFDDENGIGKGSRKKYTWI